MSLLFKKNALCAAKFFKTIQYFAHIASYHSKLLNLYEQSVIW